LEVVGGVFIKPIPMRALCRIISVRHGIELNSDAEVD
jgi:hypothetical protein